MWDLSGINWNTKRNNKRKNAKSRGIDFKLSRSSMKTIYERNGGVCDYTGERMSLVDGDPKQASLERLDESKGYFPSNCILCTAESNSLKAKYLELNRNDGKYLITKEEKVIINKVCSVLFNPDNMKALRDKYTNTEAPEKLSEAISSEDEQCIQENEKASVTVTHERFEHNTEDNKEKEMTAEFKTYTPSNPEISTARKYAEFGEFTENICGSEFGLTYVEFSRKIRRKTCSLTGRSLEEEGVGYFIKDKTVCVDKDNLMIVSKQVQESLDKLSVDANLSWKELQKICKILSK